jgi:ubiquinone/menaquinone biosynthesis C-methylase UbiE
MHQVIEQVPVDYYQSGVKKNSLQRLWHMRKLAQVLSHISDKPKYILDVGCASGWFLSEVAKKHQQASLHGVDIYHKGVEYGKKLYPKLQFQTADAHALPFKDEFFDLVICTEVLEHVEQPQVVLGEMKRVLKKGGQAIIELDSGSVLFSVVWYLWRKFQGKVWNDSHIHSFTVQKLERAIRECDFKLERKSRFHLGMAMVFSIRK